MNLKGYGLTLFFILIPFSYFIQVITNKPELVAIIYLIFLLDIFYLNRYFLFKYKFNNNIQILDLLLLLCLVFVVGQHAVSIFYEIIFGDMGYASRGFFIYFVPFLIILFVFKSEELIFRVIKILSIVGIIIAFELTYENYNIYILKRSSWFQLLSRDYVYSVTGIDMVRFYEGNYRPTGLLEHVHCTVFFVGLASLAWLVRFFEEKKKTYLIAFGICVAVVALHGARLAFLASFLGILFFILNEYTYSKKEFYNINLALFIFLFTIIFILFLDPFGTVKLYYLSVIYNGDYGIVNNGSPLSVNNMEVNNFFDNSPIGLLISNHPISLNTILHAILGFGVIGSLKGVPGTSDDAFYLQLIGQYGLFGSLIFFSMWIYSIFLGYKNLGIVSSHQRLLINYAISTLVVFILSVIHSPAIQRKALYPIFILSLAIVFNQQFKQYFICKFSKNNVDDWEIKKNLAINKSEKC